MTLLKYIALDLTYICENKCLYCYVGNKEKEKHPSFGKIKDVIEKLAKNNVKEILLVGGNPCTYPHLKKVVEVIKNLNLKNKEDV